MTKLILNNTEIPIHNYNRYTSITENGVESGANFSPVSADTYDSIVALSAEVITDISIEVNDNEIYSLTNQNARITNISENVYEGGESMNIDVSLTFESVKE